MLLQIPREVMEQQAADKGDIEFFELAYLEVEIKQPKKLTAQVTLKDFVIPNTELIPEDVRGKVKKWSDYIDYWAVDWDFQNDTFMQGWVAYRTREGPISAANVPTRTCTRSRASTGFSSRSSTSSATTPRRPTPWRSSNMAKAVIAYDKDLPEIPDRCPWERPNFVPRQGRIMRQRVARREIRSAAEPAAAHRQAA